MSYTTTIDCTVRIGAIISVSDADEGKKQFTEFANQFTKFGKNRRHMSMATDGTGKRVRELRKALGLTQETFGLKMDFWTSGGGASKAISQIENGAAPSTDVLAAIAETYNVSLDWLILGKPEAAPECLKGKDTAASMPDEPAPQKEYLGSFEDAINKPVTLFDFFLAVIALRDKLHLDVFHYSVSLSEKTYFSEYECGVANEFWAIVIPTASIYTSLTGLTCGEKVGMGFSEISRRMCHYMLHLSAILDFERRPPELNPFPTCNQLTRNTLELLSEIYNENVAEDSAPEYDGWQLSRVAMLGKTHVSRRIGVYTEPPVATLPSRFDPTTF